MTDLDPAATEIALQRLVTVHVVTGLIFLLLPPPWPAVSRGAA